MKTEIATCPAPLHTQTPLIYSNSLSRIVPGAQIYLKMECCQVAGSYKIRGIGRRCQLVRINELNIYINSKVHFLRCKFSMIKVI